MPECRPHLEASRVKPDERLRMVSGKPNDATRVGDRHRLQQRRIDDAEDRGVRANAKRQDEDNDGGERWRSKQCTQRLRELLNHGSSWETRLVQISACFTIPS